MVKTASKKLKGEKITPTQTDITSQIESTTQLFQNVDNNQNDITTSINNLNNVNDVSNTILNKTKSKPKATKVTKAKPNESTSIIQANTVDVVNVVKAKRGRKSKKDLMAALNMANNIVVANPLQLQINEINNVSSDNLLSMSSANSASSATFLDCAQNMVISSNHDTTDDNHDMINKDLLISDHTPVIKKRGRKPKGGKIIQQVVSINNQNVERPNIILHLKCSMKDLQTSTNSCLIESFNFTNKNDLSYELLNSTNINEGKSYIDSKTSNQIMETIPRIYGEN